MGESESIRERFLRTGDALTAVRERTASVDRTAAGLFDANFGNGQASGIALLAVGGYGRRQLFPSSDVDLLFLVEKQAVATAARDSISALLRELWDRDQRASQSVHTPAECATLTPGNSELSISLLDLRFLAGDRLLYEKLEERLAVFYARERDSLVRALAELTRTRHAKYGETIYHLEPHIKDTPGGQRDFQLACWLTQLANISPGTPLPQSEKYLPPEATDELFEAKRFLFAVRCHLHYLNQRDNNTLTFEHQERIAAAHGFAAAGDPAAWMRDYFRHVRVVHRQARRLLEEATTPQNSMFAMFRDRLTRLSNADFAVSRGLVFVRHPDALEADPSLMLRLFEFLARHGLPAAPETERRVARAVPAFRAQLPGGGTPLWPAVAAILRLPHAYRSLAAMHETGLLTALFPEYERIDCLVVRDFYHRYTVDEHSLRTIKTLHELKGATDPLTQHFAGVMAEIERPEVLLFALLFHDVGKGDGTGEHTAQGLLLVEGAMKRLGLPEPDRDTVRFLIRHHLDMSATMTKRDLADPATAQAFAGVVSTIERLQKLALLTYADISAVNPEALTPWRKDLLWQLYVATFNQLTLELEADRIGAAAVPLAEQIGRTPAECEAVRQFLEGLPTRYVRTHAPEQIAEHFRLEDTFRQKKVAVQLVRRHALWEAIVLAPDRPFLFASFAGTLSSFAMNIVKAEAFANSSGMVLDTMVFADPGRLLELNPPEVDRLRSTLERVMVGKIDVHELLQKRSPAAPSLRPRVARHVAFDNETSAHDTIFHVIAEDRPGLLYDLASTFSFNDCDIDVVLIDTEAHKALDVFYVSSSGGKLADEPARLLCAELERACAGGE